MSKPRPELIDTVEGLLRQADEDRKAVEAAKSALNRTETALLNAQNELGSKLEQAGVVGSDFRLVNRKAATAGALQHVFGIVHEIG